MDWSWSRPRERDHALTLYVRTATMETFLSVHPIRYSFGDKPSLLTEWMVQAHRETTMEIYSIKLLKFSSIHYVEGKGNSLFFSKFLLSIVITVFIHCSNVK